MRARVILGADHGGFELKERLEGWLLKRGYEVVDMGADKLDSGDDFVDYAKKAVGEFRLGGDRLILLCRNGVGMSIVVNRFKNIRCVLGFDEEQIRRARVDDNVNCLSLPADYIDLGKAKKFVSVFLETKFSEEERFVRRLKKIEEIVVD